MKRKIPIILVVLAVVAAAVGILLRGKSGPYAPVTVTLRIAVVPKERVDFVIRQANSARFKYEIGHQAGLKPVLAQKLSVQLASDSSLVDMQLRVPTQEDARRYVEAFVEVLQAQCGNDVQLSRSGWSAR